MKKQRDADKDIRCRVRIFLSADRKVIMKIAVRLDDITPDMDWERFLKCKAILDRYQVKPLIGVVPDNRDDMLKGKTKESRALAKEAMPGGEKDFGAYVQQLQKEGWAVSMHGYRHIYSTKKGGLFPLNDFSEFAGIPYEEQKRMLSEGRRILKEKGIGTEMFMAPAHSYDRNTLRALKETGFTALTDGFGSRPYRYRGLTFYPISFHLSRTLKKKKGFSTMVIHTQTATDADLERYERWFSNPDIAWISWQEYIEQAPAARHLPGRLLEFCMAKGKFLIGKGRQLL